MQFVPSAIARRVVALLVVAPLALASTAELDAAPLRPVPHPALRASTLRAAAALDARSAFWFADSLVGISGKLRARFVTNDHPAFAVSAVEELFGDSALSRPGVYTVFDSSFTRPLSFITLVPFADKARGRIGDYRIGFWPREHRRVHDGGYELPDGFIRVTPANEDTWVSQHFQLRDFLTHDQQDVWPKYLVLSDRLLDKLELVIQDLQDHGYPVDHMTIMSGFRTPEYNRQGVGRRGGRAFDSRHQYGDAADVFVDNTGSGRMSDLNHDGHVNTRDAEIILAAVNRVEAEHPDLVGGAGVYRATRAHGPFVHIDARGDRARWGVR